MKKSEINLLGYSVRDVVTERTGVVVSISYDLAGCIQAYVVPKVDKDGKVAEGFWVDTKRAKVSSREPVQLRPNFEGIDGGTDLPRLADKAPPP